MYTYEHILLLVFCYLTVHRDTSCTLETVVAIIQRCWITKTITKQAHIIHQTSRTIKMFMDWKFQPLEISAEYYIWMLPGCRCWRRGAVCVTRSWARAREFPAAFLYTPAASSEETPPTTARCKWHYEHCKAVDDEHELMNYMLKRCMIDKTCHTYVWWAMDHGSLIDLPKMLAFTP